MKNALTPDSFGPEAMAGYAAQGLRFLFIALGCALAVTVFVAGAWFIRFWRTGA